MLKNNLLKAVIIVLIAAILITGVHFALDKIQENRKQKINDDLNNVIVKMANGEPVSIVCYGDSITAGGGPEKKGPSKISYPMHLEVLLREYYMNPLITVKRIGIGGVRVDRLIKLWKEKFKYLNPDLILFMGGTNDANSGEVSVKEFAWRVEKVKRLAGNTPIVFLNITPRFKQQNGANGTKIIDVFRQVYIDKAQKYDMHFIDVFEGMMDLYKDRALVRGVISPDGSHYKNLGYQHIAEIVFEREFVNDDIRIKSGQFKDIGGQWIVTKGEASEWKSIESLDRQLLKISKNYVELFLYVEEWEPSNLVVHFTMDSSESANENVNITNLDFINAVPINITTSPKEKDIIWYDCAVPVCELKGGLNRIKFETDDISKISGFSVIATDKGLYQEPSFNVYGKSYEINNVFDIEETNKTEIISDMKVCDKNSSIMDAFKIIPNISDSTGYRIRAFVNQNTSFLLGQQSNMDGYLSTHAISFDEQNATFDLLRTDGKRINVAKIPFSVSKDGKDVKIDIITNNKSFSVWVDNILLYEDEVPLGIGNFIIINESGENAAVINPVIETIGDVSMSDVIIGEEWISFSDNIKHIIGVDEVERTASYIE